MKESDIRYLLGEPKCTHEELEEAKQQSEVDPYRNVPLYYCFGKHYKFNRVFGYCVPIEDSHKKRTRE